jgi:cell division protein FtsZ
MGQIKPAFETFARIRVVGVGGAGNKVIQRMMASNIHGIDFVAVNLDAQDLNVANAQTKILIGKNLTRGLGAGMNPEVGRQAAMDSSDEIADALKGSDMVFITAGMGGGTGTGAAPVVAEIARDIGALTVGVVTKPFAFEGAARGRIAEQGWQLMKEKVDSLITIQNDRLLSIIDRKTPLLEAFAKVDDVVRHGVQGISDLITIPGIINVDFADVKAIMSNSGSALMGIGHGMGDDRAVEAAKMAINSPLLEIAIDGARGLLFNVSGGPDLAMSEISDAARVITEKIDPNAKVIFGSVFDDKLKKGEIKVTVIATGFNVSDSQPQHPESHSALLNDVFANSFARPTPPVQPPPQTAPPRGMPSMGSFGNGSSNGAYGMGNGNGMSSNIPSHEYNRGFGAPPQTPPPQFIPATPASVREAPETIIDDEDSFEIPAFIRRKMKN